MNTSPPPDKLQAYREPMVNATGILLGFILNFAAGWVKADTPLSDSVAYAVGFSVLLGIILLIIVLYRVLRMRYPREAAEDYYQRTLMLFITGLSLAFLGVLIDMFSHFMDNSPGTP